MSDHLVQSDIAEGVQVSLGDLGLEHVEDDADHHTGKEKELHTGVVLLDVTWGRGEGGGVSE